MSLESIGALAICSFIAVIGLFILFIIQVHYYEKDKKLNKKLQKDFDKLKEQFDSYKVIINNVSSLVISNELNKFKAGKK